jgi:hypothetical protein
MRVRRGSGWTILFLWVAAGVGKGWAAPGTCARAVIEGEVRSGQGYQKAIGEGLEVMLEPLASGWILRVLPKEGQRPEHDYAELATPPYQSVSPLLVSTDFSFRAQDAMAWNPRHFRFAADKRLFTQMSEAYIEYRKTPGSTTSRDRLAELVSRAPEGLLQILDAHLVPGQGDQAKMAAAVASHFSDTAHSLEKPEEGKGTLLGKLTWMRFRISLELPEEFRVDRGAIVERYDCSKPPF